ncbi:hypothetical protein BGZ61DRAFT_446051 [Ilyonectria robusta]|uniref:uncharacterized protein n=1 Tax=Ilyonectria robusta TaxID=1079257 RepID=UPI001E8CD2DF|nr:uncharacterized protein BGZ61DRAFT_446051 [Ilyonectria robusta]KAH8729254.1 hypothetical protein BGZ61DRAFT_446051 [Ilyonectria robusta]
MTRPETERTLMCNHGVHCIPAGNGCFVNVLASIAAKNWCRFAVGGKGAKSECGRILRRVIDECDTSLTQFKQDGYLGRLLLLRQAVMSILSFTTMNTLTQSIYLFLTARAIGV